LPQLFSFELIWNPNDMSILAFWTLFNRDSSCYNPEKKNNERTADDLPALLPHPQYSLLNQLFQTFLF
jgi:hypothetical protein